MGQLLSDLVNTRVNEKFQRMTSSEEYLLLIFQSSSIATSSNTSHVNQETENENAPVALLNLPSSTDQVALGMYGFAHIKFLFMAKRKGRWGRRKFMDVAETAVFRNWQIWKLLVAPIAYSEGAIGPRAITRRDEGGSAST